MLEDADHTVMEAARRCSDRERIHHSDKRDPRDRRQANRESAGSADVNARVQHTIDLGVESYTAQDTVRMAHGQEGDYMLAWEKSHPRRPCVKPTS